MVRPGARPSASSDTACHLLPSLQAKITDAEAADVKAYRAALADGWSADELRKLGLDEPDKKQRVRRRAAARKSSSSDTANKAQPVAPDAAATGQASAVSS